MRALAIFAPLLIALLGLSLAYGGEGHGPHQAEGLNHKHGSHPECPLPKSAMDVISCALKNNPKAKRAILASENSLTLSGAAGQLPNPEFEGELTKGKDSASSTEISLVQPIEWGGKRSARIKGAEAEAGKASAEQRQIQAEVLRETVKNLHRLRQLDLEKSIVKDTIETLQKILKQQQSRPGLSPEQQVTVSVYRMALADAKIKESESFDEEREIEHYFHVSTGHSLPELRPVLPKAPATWAEIGAEAGTSGPSPALGVAFAERDSFLSGMEAAGAEAWPNLKIGPAAKIENGAGKSESAFGLKLMMDLPFFSLNGGGRQHAQASLLRAEKEIELTRQEENHERAEQVKVYRSAVEALKLAPTLDLIEKDYARNQSFAERGLISGALLIEFHRQRTELVRSRNARELKAIEALWLIHQLDGRIFSEIL